MSHVALIAPPERVGAGRFASGVIPPLGVAYLASSLLAVGHRVTLVDAVGEAPAARWRWGRWAARGLDAEGILERIPRDVDMIGVSSRYTAAHGLVSALCERLGAARPDVALVVGGPHATACPELVLSSPAVDWVVLGEGERTLRRLVDVVAGRAGVGELDGVAYRDGARVLVRPPTPLSDLDALPWPARHLLPMESYWQAREPHGAQRGRWANVLATRGCSYDCAFCTSPGLVGRRIRARSPRDVVDEVEHLARTYGVTDIHFADDNLTVNRRWTRALSEELIARDLGVTWQLGTGVRVETLDRELLSLLRRSGLRNLTLAPESGSDWVRRTLMRKRMDLDDVRRVTRDALAVDLRVCLFFLLGYPGETRAEAEETIRFAREMAQIGADEASFGTFVPLPGSVAFDELQRAGRVRLDEAFFDALALQADLAGARSWSDALTDPELTRLRRRGMATFYLQSFASHPHKLARLLRNLLAGRQETKTDRVVQARLPRLFRRATASGRA